ncbi:hypothetical protein Tco_1417621 [Tanacetum coccineum]
MLHQEQYKHAQLNKKTLEEIQVLYIKEQERIADFVPIGSKKDERLIQKMNKKVASVHEEKVLEEPNSTKVEVKQEGNTESIRKRSGRRLKMSKQDNYGVHTLTLEDGTEIHMLAKRKYPLTKETLERMMSLKLIAKSASESAYNLLRFIQKHIDEYGSNDGSEMAILLDLSKLATTLNRLERSIQTGINTSLTREMLIDDINQLQDLLNLLAMHLSNHTTNSTPSTPILPHTITFDQVEHHVGYCPCCRYNQAQFLAIREDLNWVEFLLTRPQPPLQIQRDYPPTTTSTPNSPPTTN